MLKRFAQLLTPRPQAEGPARGIRDALATCVVLLEAARIDDAFSDEERRHILDVVRVRFELDEEEAEELLREATDARKESTDLWRFTRAINEAYTPDEKIRIIEEVWRIFYSDGTLDRHEDHLAHKLRALLNLNHPQLIQAKVRVLDEIRGRSSA